MTSPGSGRSVRAADHTPNDLTCERKPYLASRRTWHSTQTVGPSTSNKRHTK